MTAPAPALRLEGVTKIFRRSHLGRVRETPGVQDVSRCDNLPVR